MSLLRAPCMPQWLFSKQKFTEFSLVLFAICVIILMQQGNDLDNTYL